MSDSKPVYTAEEKFTAIKAVKNKWDAIPFVHGYPDCDCDLEGGDPDCKRQPPYRTKWAEIEDIAIDLQMRLTRAEELLREAPFPAALATSSLSTADQIDFAIAWQKQRLAFLAEGEK